MRNNSFTLTSYNFCIPTPMILKVERPIFVIHCNCYADETCKCDTWHLRDIYMWGNDGELDLHWYLCSFKGINPGIALHQENLLCKSCFKNLHFCDSILVICQCCLVASFLWIRMCKLHPLRYPNMEFLECFSKLSHWNVTIRTQFIHPVLFLILLGCYL